MNRFPSILFFLTISGALFAGSYERFEENGKVGIKDNSGKIILPASFDALGWSDGNFSVIGQITGYRQQNRWGLLTLKKEFITRAEFESLTSPGGDRVIVSKFINPFNLKFGCLNLAGKLVIPLSYDDLTIHGLRAIVMVKNGTRYEHGLIDLHNRSILPVQYKKIIPIGSLRYSAQNFSDKTALCTEEGTWITNFFIDSISGFSHDLAVIHKEWRQGVIDRNGVVKVEPLYREVKITGPGRVMVRKADEWKMIDASYHDLLRIEADELRFSSRDWSRITLDGKSGFVDEHFQPAWPLDYDYLGPIENQKVIAKRKGKYGLLRLDQSAVLPIEFDSVCLQENFIRTLQRTAGKVSWSLYDTFGIKKTSTFYEFLGPFHTKLFLAKNHGYWGGIDRYGKEQIACVYDSLLEINEDLIVVRFKGQYGIITHQDQWRLLPQNNPVKLVNRDCFIERQHDLLFLKEFSGNILYFTNNPITIFPDHLLESLSNGTERKINFQGQIVDRKEQPEILPGDQFFREREGLTGIKRDGKFGFVDNRGRLRIANRYEAVGEFHNGLAPVKLLGKWGFINSSDQIVIQPTYDATENFEHRAAYVLRNGKAGLIDAKGNVLLELRYDSIQRLPSQLILLTHGSLKGLADSNGRILIEPRFDSLVVLVPDSHPSADRQDHDGHVIVKQSNLYGLLTTDGLSIFPIQYSKLSYEPQKNVFIAQQKSSWESVEVR